MVMLMSEGSLIPPGAGSKKKKNARNPKNPCLPPSTARKFGKVPEVPKNCRKPQTGSKKITAGFMMDISYIYIYLSIARCVDITNKHNGGTRRCSIFHCIPIVSPSNVSSYTPCWWASTTLKGIFHCTQPETENVPSNSKDWSLKKG